MAKSVEKMLKIKKPPKLKPVKSPVKKPKKSGY